MIAAVEQTDDDLLQAAKLGDQGAFGELVDRHRERYLSQAYRVVNSREDAEDVVQEAGLAAFKSLHQFRGDCPFAAWMYQFVILRARRWISRRRRKRPGRLAELPICESWQEPSTTQQSPAHVAIRNERIMLVRAAINRLPEPYRTTIRLRDIKGLKLREVADRLGLPLPTVAGHVYRGERLLKADLAEVLGEREASNDPDSRAEAEATEGVLPEHIHDSLDVLALLTLKVEKAPDFDSRSAFAHELLKATEQLSAELSRLCRTGALCTRAVQVRSAVAS